MLFVLDVGYGMFVYMMLILVLSSWGLFLLKLKWCILW